MPTYYLNIVVLTNRCAHGAAILRALHAGGIGLRAIVVEVPAPLPPTARLRRLLRERGLRGTLASLLGKLAAKLHRADTPATAAEWESVNFYRQFTDEVHVVANFNDPTCVELLRGLQPDLIVLGGARILKSPTMQTARLAVLNAHPGLLPRYRGVHVIPWAVLNGDPLGVTVHVVNDGVDTGGICRQGTITPVPGDTLAGLQAKVEALAGRLMLQTIHEVQATGEVHTTPNPPEGGTLYHRMDPATLAAAEAKLRERVGA